MMDQAGKHTNHSSGITGQNISYYNEIAGSYNSIMDSDPNNELVRQRVGHKMRETLDGGWVLDFGGGTGKDLFWLTLHGYNVMFCEPSTEMKEKALVSNKDLRHRERIVYMEGDATDFANWHMELPFYIKVDAILSNFAVINSIPNISLLFKNLALVTKPGGHLIALVLRYNTRNMLKAGPLAFIRSFILGKPAIIQVQYKTRLQTVYKYTSRQIKKAAGPWFDLISIEPVENSGFTLLHFTRR